MNKHIPFKGWIKKVSGTSYYLPLPMEETIKKLCKENDIININQELYILVRSIPNNSKIVWQNLVDVNKGWKALKWYKNNNEFYSLIDLPTSSEDLRDIINNLPKVEFKSVPNASEDSKDIAQINGKANSEVNDDNNLGSKIIKIDGKDHNAILTCVSESHPIYMINILFTLYKRLVLMKKQLNCISRFKFRLNLLHGMKKNRSAMFPR